MTTEEQILKEEVQKAIDRTADRLKVDKDQRERQAKIAELRAENEAIGTLAIELQGTLRPGDKAGGAKVKEIHAKIEQNEQEIARLTPVQRDTSGGYVTRK